MFFLTVECRRKSKIENRDRGCGSRNGSVGPETGEESVWNRRVLYQASAKRGRRRVSGPSRIRRDQPQIRSGCSAVHPISAPGGPAARLCPRSEAVGLLEVSVSFSSLRWRRRRKGGRPGVEEEKLNWWMECLKEGRGKGDRVSWALERGKCKKGWRPMWKGWLKYKALYPLDPVWRSNDS